MKLENIIDVNKDRIVTVVGAGGKTSLINYLVKFYKENFKVLSTTTTKIYPPDNDSYEYIYMLDNDKTIEINSDNCAVVCGSYINSDGKIVGLKQNQLDTLINKFDLSFIEGDGSKRKKLKGWNNNEPVVFYKTSKTIGVLDITSYGMDINEENIHRIEEFRKITDIRNQKITVNNLCDVVLNKNGLFKNACGEKVLLINKVENSYYEKITEDLINKIKKHNEEIIIVYGSIKKGIIKRG